MAGGLFSSGCCCSATCDTFTDNFNVSDTGDVTGTASDLYVDTGTWTITSSQLKTTSTQAVVGSNTAPVSGTSTARLTAKIYGNTGDKAKLILGMSDSSNYLFGQWTFNGVGSTMAVGERVSGSDTILQSKTISLSSGDEVSLCYDEDTQQLRANNSVADVRISRAAPYLIVGLGTGGTAANVRFDDFTLSDLNDSCPNCSKCATAGCCDYVQDDATQIALSFAGLTCVGGGCAVPAGDFVLDKAAIADWLHAGNSTSAIVSTTICQQFHGAFFTLPSGACASTSVRFVLTITNSSNACTCSTTLTLHKNDGNVFTGGSGACVQLSSASDPGADGHFDFGPHTADYL